MFAHPSNHAVHMAPHYRLPADHLFVPQVDFWEIVCYRADVENGLFQLRHRDMMGLLCHPTLAQARREALRGPSPPLVAVEEEGERFYVLRAQAEGWPGKVLCKLRAYVERGWIVQLGRHRHAKWVLNYLLLECQRRTRNLTCSGWMRIVPIRRDPPADHGSAGSGDILSHIIKKTRGARGKSQDAIGRFALTWMKLKKALEETKGKKVEYRKLKDGFLLLERLGIVTPLTDRSTAKLGYAQRFQHRLNLGRLLDVAPKFLRRCQPRQDDPLTLTQTIFYVLRTFVGDHQRQKRAVPWSLDRLHDEVEVDLEIEHRSRVPLRRELIWTTVGVLTQAGILGHERAGYALTPLAVERSRDPTGLEAWAMAALAQAQSGLEEKPALSFSQIAQLDELLSPCRQRDAARADLTRAIVLQMNYPPQTALPLFALLRRRIDRISEEHFTALLAHFADRRVRGSFSQHPADVLDDFAPRRKRDRRTHRVIARKTLKGRRTVVQGQFDVQVAPSKILQARLYCTLRHGRPIPSELVGQPLDICLCAGDCELYCATVSLLNIPDDPLFPVDITVPLRTLTKDSTLTLRLTLPAGLPALRLLARIEVDVVKHKV
jgi:hypothetical protein